jgi:hypothetical protein
MNSFVLLATNTQHCSGPRHRAGVYRGLWSLSGADFGLSESQRVPRRLRLRGEVYPRPNPAALVYGLSIPLWQYSLSVAWLRLPTTDVSFVPCSRNISALSYQVLTVWAHSDWNSVVIWISNPPIGRGVAQAVSRRLPNLAPLGSSPGQIMLHLLWTERHCDTFSPRASV